MAERLVYVLDEANKVTVHDGGGPWRVTSALRFKRNAGGFRILQQLYASDGGDLEWRDIPMVQDNG